MPKYRVTISRLLMATSVVAVPLAIFGQYGTLGYVVSMVIALPALLICLVATHNHLPSMYLIFASTIVGGCIGSMPVAVRRTEAAHNTQLGAVVGCMIGLALSERYYSKRYARIC